MEEWKDIEGFPGYQASNMGYIRSLDRKQRGRILRPIIGPDGYARISFSINGVTSTHLLHRMIALTFIPFIDGKLTVDHISQNKLDNRVYNLRWADMFVQNLNKTRLPGVSKHKYIHITPCGKYEVKVRNSLFKLSKNFKTLEEAITYRDSLNLVLTGNDL